MELDILAAILLPVLVLSMFGVAGPLLLALGRWALEVVRFPFAAIGWVVGGRLRRRRKRNYEVLATYLPAISDNPRLVSYVEQLIEEGIEPERLRDALARNARVAEAADVRRRMREMLAEAECRAGIAELSARQQSILAQSQAQLERLRFKERVLSGLFSKIRAKYRV